MSDLTHSEKRSFEKLFGMSSGYVLDFSNRTFEEFIIDVTGKNIFDQKYDYASGSKANRLRAFWSDEPNYIVAKLLAELLKNVVEDGVDDSMSQVLENCKRTVKRLSESAPVPDIESLTPISSEKSFSALAKAVKESIEKNEPETGLDRLHTFIVKYLRTLCEKHGIEATRTKPLHSLMGEYIKYLKEVGMVKSQMSERILKSSISTLEAFNYVRNEQSYAHDNEVLGYDESLLIFNQICSIVRFIGSIEKDIDEVNIQYEDKRE